MSSIKLVVYDFDQGYVANLMQYIRNYSSRSIELACFHNKNSLARYISSPEVEYDILLTSSLEGLEIDNEQKVMKLTSNKTSIEGEIYKYQSLENIVRIILEKYYGDQATMFKSDSLKLISVISPCGGVGKTTYSKYLGRALSERKKVLFINFDGYLGQDKYSGRCLTNLISKLMDSYTDNSHNIKDFIVNGDNNNLHFLNMIESQIDHKRINDKNIDLLLKAIVEHCDFEYIIVDLGNLFIDSNLYFIRNSDEFRIVYEDSHSGRHKLNHYIRDLEDFEEYNMVEIVDKSVLVANFSKGSERIERDRFIRQYSIGKEPNNKRIQSFSEFDLESEFYTILKENEVDK